MSPLTAHSPVTAPAADYKLPLEMDMEKVRHDFPILSREVNGYPLVYLDNAATTQKPSAVIERIKQYYEEENANIHRGVHWLSERATQAYEASREAVRAFINAASTKEIIFTRGTTEGINLVAATYGRRNVGPGDEVIISSMEHHSNIVPWQLLCEEKGARLRVIPMDDHGILRLDEFEKMLNRRTKLVSVVHVSNALGTVTPIKKIVDMAHAHGVPVMVDGAQSTPHLQLDVQQSDCDFLAFSAHKIYGPTGVGVLYGKQALLEAMPPYQGGGEMIDRVTFEKTTFNVLPHKFEAGTPNIAGVVGLGAAIEYINSIGMNNIATYEQNLLSHATSEILKVPGVRVIGTALCKASLISFVMDCAHATDIGTLLDEQGIAIRTGHHCAQPVMQRMGVPATARVSFAFYNTRQEVDIFIRALHKVRDLFQ